MSKKNGIIFLTIIILLILIIFTIFLLLQIIKKGENEIVDDNNNFNESNVILDYSTKVVRDATKFFTVSECVNKYYSAIKAENTQKIYSLLDDEYIANNNINENNVLNVLDKIKGDINIEKMNYMDGESKQQYSVLISVEDSYVFLIVNLDTANFTFSIKPIDKQLYQELNEIELTNNINSIDNNEYNKFNYVRYTDEDIVYMYFEYYNKLLNENYEKAYKLLEEEYKNLRFSKMEVFKEYVTKTAENRKSSVVSKYQIEKNLDYNEYIIIDTYNNYYIIKEYSTMNFTIQLDNYTIKPDNYLEEYNKLSQEEQLSTNINLFINMVNNRDYNAIYNILDETFKQNNFSNFENFKKHIDKEFFNYNVIELVDAKNEGQIFIYNLKIKSGVTNNALEKDFTLIIKLKENADFVMSFSFA